MVKIKILPEISSILNLQKCCISEQLLPASSHGKFVSITILCASNSSNECPYNLSCLCQIFLSKTMHPSFCNLNMSVCGYVNSSDKKIYPVSSVENLNCVSMDNFNILDSVSNIKSASVTVVLNKPRDVHKWRNQSAKMSELVKNILKLFTLKSGSVVFLDCVRTLYDSDIYCILLENLGKVNIGHVVSSTKVKVSKVISKITFEQIYSMGKELPILGGLEKPMKTLTNIVKTAATEKVMEISHAVYKQVLIVGPTGCGKTALVQTVSKNCGMVLQTLVGPELSSPLPGEAEKALTTLFDECRLLAQECRGGCVLLIDQVESVCRRRESSSEGHLMRIANQLFMLLETVNNTAGLVVVGTSSRPQALDPALRRPGHFDHEIHIGMSNETERASILRAVTRQYSLSDLVSDDVARWTPGFVGADFALLATNVSRRLEKLGLPISCDVREELLSHWRVCVGQQQPSALKGQLGVIRSDSATLSDLGGVELVKGILLQAIQWPLTHPEAFYRLGLPQPKGVLLFGPPGCAKTSLVRAIASATNTTFLAVSAAQVYSPYVGDAERTISELFHRARIGAPAILFIDEIDALVGCRGSREKGTQERILSAFLTEMDGVGLRLDSGTSQVGVVVVAATNRPDMLDPALTRPGRFDRLIYVGPPDTNQRLDILRTVSKKMPLAADVNLPLLSEKTALYSGADLAQLCKEAGLCAMTQEGMDVQEVSQKHWLSALAAMKPSLSADQIERYQRMSATSDWPR